MVQIWMGRSDDGAFGGSVEEVDTGVQIQFHSEEELLSFLRKRCGKARGHSTQKEENK